MNKRGMGWALTVLISAGIIAMMFVGLYVSTGAVSDKDVFDVKANLAGISTAGQARGILAIAADDIAQAKYDRVAQLVKEAYGPEATHALWVNDVRVNGQKIDTPTARADITLPTYDGKNLKIALEVQR